MTKITISAEMAAQLAGMTGPVQFCDESGVVLGFYQPGAASIGSTSLREMSPFSDEEIVELDKQEDGRPLDDILKDLSQS